MEKKDTRVFLKKIAPIVFLILIFSTALWFRSFPARFNEIQALDPFFFYRMGLEVMDNDWKLDDIDEMRYHPGGEDTKAKHFMLPIYLPAMVFAGLSGIGLLNMHYLNFAIMWPAVLGALAIIPMYFLGKELFNSKTAGLFSAFFLATVPSFITRTSAGFFEKEPIAGLFIMTSAYFFIRAYKRSSWLSGTIAGASLAIVGMTWGGVNFVFLLFASFVAVLFLANIGLVVLDYVFGGLKKNLENLSGYLDIRMIKAYVPLVVVGVLAQEPLVKRGAPLDSTSVIFSLMMAGILAVKYGSERFRLVKPEMKHLVVPGTAVFLLLSFLVGAMFFDDMAVKLNSAVSYFSFGKSTVGQTVAENAPGNWGNIASTTGTGFASAVVPQLSSISPFFAIWIFMFLGMGLLVYRFYKTRDWLSLVAVIWLVSSFMSVFFVVRLIFLVGPPAALVAGFFAAWVVERGMRSKHFRMPDLSNLRDSLAKNPVLIGISIFVLLTVVVNSASAYAYSTNIGPSICFPRYNSDNPFDVQPCVTIDEDGNEVLSGNQPWYEAFNFLANETPEGSSVLSWWDFGYWFQARGQRPSLADGGHTGGALAAQEGIYAGTDRDIAQWYTNHYDNWENHTDWFAQRDVDYILMDYTLPGKYGAISKISSEGEQVVGILQFSQKGVEPNGDSNVYIFQNGQYEIWLPLDQAGSLSGTPMFLISQNGQYVQRGAINDVCTASGVISAGDDPDSIPGCVAISDLGIYYVPPEAEHTIFTDLMFMNGFNSPVEKVFDNQLVKIYKYTGEK